MATRNAKLAKARRYFGLPTHPTGRIREVDIPRREFFNENEEVILKAVDEDNLNELVEEMIRVLKKKDEEEKESEATQKVQNSGDIQPSFSMNDSDIMAITRSYYNNLDEIMNNLELRISTENKRAIVALGGTKHIISCLERLMIISEEDFITISQTKDHFLENIP